MLFIIVSAFPDHIINVTSNVAIFNLLIILMKRLNFLFLPISALRLFINDFLPCLRKSIQLYTLKVILI